MNYFIFGNYGDNTIALIQWAHNKKLTNTFVINVETGWCAPSWEERINAGQSLAKKYNFEVVTLKPKMDFVELIRSRKSFPTIKYQWCPTFLKALPFLSWLDEIDLDCKGTVVLGSRRADSRARIYLDEFIDESEHYGNRKVWYPLFEHSNEMRAALIARTGLKILNHRSLECHPCIHSTQNELQQLSETTIEKVLMLEKEIGQLMFNDTSINAAQKFVQVKDSFETFDMGCGSHFVCGE